MATPSRVMAAQKADPKRERRAGPNAVKSGTIVTKSASNAATIFLLPTYLNPVPTTARRLKYQAVPPSKRSRSTSSTPCEVIQLGA